MAAAQEHLSVIALISGGKDSFYSILHCQANGHRVVALANLYPPDTVREASTGAGQEEDHQPPTQTQVGGTIQDGNNDGETDLNSFMYQTVGHQIIPLYAQATGLPLYRQQIVGTAVHHGLSYETPSHETRAPVASGGERREEERQPRMKLGQEQELEDETESLIPLLRAVLKAHPEANALCTGAILSTYQRTRVESVALRLGLVPLSYLWQFTELPAAVPRGLHDQVSGVADRVAAWNSGEAKRRARKRTRNPARDDARLLRDMAAVGLEARIIKVASAGLDEDFLWENVASDAGVRRVERAMRRFGAAGGRGSILGEGGEFETLVVDGQPSLFKGRVSVSDEDKRVIREGGGCAWLSFRRADVLLKDELAQTGQLPDTAQEEVDIPVPELLDPRFQGTLRCLLADDRGPRVGNGASCDGQTEPTANSSISASSSYSVPATGLPRCGLPLAPQSFAMSHVWCYFGSGGAESFDAESQTVSIVDQIRRQLDAHALPATAITNSVIVLRHMADFPVVNGHYGSLFCKPNPPSRVTISCGDELLPGDAAIAVYLTVQPGLRPHERRGLHVQSRSYWAPANIGPYSQAIAFPLVSLRTDESVNAENEDESKLSGQSHVSGSPLAVSIAGQIPLLPASMVLPPSSTEYDNELQITLALQHLWRVGVEMQVRWWTSAVAYFPAASSTEAIRRRALLAAAAWKAAHLWPDVDNENKARGEHEMSDDDNDDNDDDAGPDIWDRRYNAEYMTYGEEQSFPLSLPDWSAVKGLDTPDDNDDDDDSDKQAIVKNRFERIPFFFVAEVEELPRQAGVEWHAHLGLAELQPGCITLLSTAGDKIASSESGPLDVSFHHVLVESGDAVFIQTTTVLRSLVVDQDKGHKLMTISLDVLRDVYAAAAVSLRKLLSLPSEVPVEPKISYTDALRIGEGDNLEDIGAIVPCRSLWDTQGRRLCAVSICETRVVKMI